jgi:hypothetical protein
MFVNPEETHQIQEKVKKKPKSWFNSINPDPIGRLKELTSDDDDDDDSSPQIERWIREGIFMNAAPG